MFLHGQLFLLCLGLGQQQGMPGAQQLGPTANLRPQMQTHPKPDSVQPNQQNSRAPVLEDSFLNQRDNGHHSKPQEPAAGVKNAFSLLFSPFLAANHLLESDLQRVVLFPVIKKYFSLLPAG